MHETFFTPDHEKLRKLVREFAENELAPHALEWDEAGEFPREVFKKAGDLGLFGIRFDPEYGGSGLDYWYTVAYGESLTYSKNAGVNMALMVQSDMATPVINDLGTPEQKREFLAPVITGDKIAALGVSEPAVGSDVARLRTTAKKQGGDWVINGSKNFITNGTRADFVTLLVRTGDEGYGGISIMLVPTDVKGFSVGQKLKKIGNKSSDTALLYFEDVKIPERYILGEEGQGFIYLMKNFQSERLIAAISACASMERVLRETIQYGNEREAFGRPLVKYQVWRHKLVEHLTAVEAARQLSYRAAWLYQQYLEKKLDMPPTKEISMAKLFASDLFQRVVYDCQQMHGGYGYMTEYSVARAFTDARLLTIGGGTSEVMKEIVAKLEGL
jgi:citronellyl-CoA dehydrogenase